MMIEKNKNMTPDPSYFSITEKGNLLLKKEKYFIHKSGGFMTNTGNFSVFMTLSDRGLRPCPIVARQIKGYLPEREYFYLVPKDAVVVCISWIKNHGRLLDPIFEPKEISQIIKTKYDLEYIPDGERGVPELPEGWPSFIGKKLIPRDALGAFSLDALEVIEQNKELGCMGRGCNSASLLVNNFQPVKNGTLKITPYINLKYLGALMKIKDTEAFVVSQHIFKNIWILFAEREADLKNPIKEWKPTTPFLGVALVDHGELWINEKKFQDLPHGLIVITHRPRPPQKED